MPLSSFFYPNNILLKDLLPLWVDVSDCVSVCV